MFKRDYYSIRTGKFTLDKEMSFEILKRIFLVEYNRLENEGYFQKYFGIDCTDGFIEGKLGSDIEVVMLYRLKKKNLFPIRAKLMDYSEDDFFDVVEFLYDHCSKGLNGSYHGWNGCGYHYSDFDDNEGKTHFRETLNPLLREYNSGFELSQNGEVLALADEGLSNLLDAEVPTEDFENISKKVENAKLKFRRQKSSIEDRREALRELADVLEFLKPEAKQYLYKKDENELFNIANNFGIRHHNLDQKVNYDKGIWYSWMFYYYLTTIHALLRIINKAKKHQLETHSISNIERRAN